MPIFTAPLHRILINHGLNLHYAYIHAFGTSTKKLFLQAPLALKHHTAICIEFLCSFSIFDTIWLAFIELTQLWILNFDPVLLIQLTIYNFNQFFSFKISHYFLFNLTSKSNLIQLKLHLFELSFWFDSTFLIQFDSSFPIQFKLTFLIQFDSDIWFNVTYSTHIWLKISGFNQLFWFNFTHNFWLNFAQHLQFNLTQSSDLIWLPLHPFRSPFLIRLGFSGSIWLIISE